MKHYLSLGSRQSVCQRSFSATDVALQDETEHESSRQLLGQCPNGAVFRILKSEWVPKEGYRSVIDARKDIGSYLMGYYNCVRPHQWNHGVSPVNAEEKLKAVSDIC